MLAGQHDMLSMTMRPDGLSSAKKGACRRRKWKHEKRSPLQPDFVQTPAPNEFIVARTDTAEPSRQLNCWLEESPEIRHMQLLGDSLACGTRFNAR